MLINLSNHPSSTWSEAQKSSANEQFGDIVDLAFPAIDPQADSHDVMELAKEYLQTCLTHLAIEKGHHAVHVMGEMTFVYAFVQLAQAQDLLCVASTSVRDVTMRDGVKEVRFQFVQFRHYLQML